VRLLRRGGHSPWSALLLLIPLVNVAFIWWLAFGRGAQRLGAGDDAGHPRSPPRSRAAETVEPVGPA
jgi:hypothetical protein